MGYYIHMREQDFFLPVDKLEEAHAAMIALDKTHDDQKHGGSWQEGKKVDRWFSWMPTNYASTLATAQAILEELGFDVQLDEMGNIISLHYDSKIGQEELFLKAIAPFVREGSYINWVGEDGAHWQHYFDGTKLIEKHGQVIYHTSLKTTTTEEE